MKRPFFTRFYDSLGHDEHLQLIFHEFNYTKNRTLHPGETLSLQVEVDTSFKPDDYDIEWRASLQQKLLATGPRCSFILDDSHVHIQFNISAFVIANKVNTHIHGTYDGRLNIIYKVLSPE